MDGSGWPGPVQRVRSERRTAWSLWAKGTRHDDEWICGAGCRGDRRRQWHWSWYPRAFADQGARVVVADIERDAAVAAAEQLATEGLAIGCDVTDRRSVEALADAVWGTSGGSMCWSITPECSRPCRDHRY